MFIFFVSSISNSFTVIAESIIISGSGELHEEDIIAGASASITNAIVNAPISILGTSLFTSFQNLSSISLPNTLIAIRGKCFQSTSLITLHLPASLEEFDTEYTFYTMSTLESFTVEAGSKHFKAVDGVLYNANLTKLIYIPVKIKEFVMPDTVEEWGFWASCGSDLGCIKVPDSMKTIMSMALVDGSIKSLEFSLNSKLSVISKKAFWQIKGIGKFNCPSLVESLEAETFMICGIEEFICSEDSRLLSIKGGAFSKCFYLTKVVLPSNFKEIFVNSFEACSSITSFTFSGTPVHFEKYNNDWYTKGREQLIFVDPKKAFIDIPSETKKINVGILSNIENISLNNNNHIAQYKNVIYSNDYKTLNIAAGQLIELSVHSSCEQISNGAFQGFKKLKSVKFEGKKVKNILNNAFQQCQALQRVVFASSIQFIYSYAFDDSGITSITLPRDLLYLGATAFRYCQSLISLDYEPGCKVTSIPSYCFQYCYKLSKVSLPDSITDIQLRAFHECPICELRLPLDINQLQDDSFLHCALTRITCNPLCHLSKILSSAFANNPDMTYVEFPPTLLSIASNSFQGCTKLEKITWHTTTTNPIPLLSTIEGGAFQDCTSITNFTIFHNLQIVSQSSFRGCTSFTDYVISGSPGKYDVEDGILYTGFVLHCSPQGRRLIRCRDSTIEIASNSFYELTKLTQIDFGVSKIKSIGEATFYRCIELRSISIPATVETIERNAFLSCSSLNEVVFLKGSALKTLCEATFAECTLLKTVVFEEHSSLQTIEQRVFEESMLETFSFPNTVSSIGFSVFSNCKRLRSIDLYNTKITEIAESTFRECISLEEVILPISVSLVGREAFRHCSKMFFLHMPGVNNICESAFEGCSSFTQ